MNNISLAPFSVVELYKNHLVQTGDIAGKAVAQPQPVEQLPVKAERSGYSFLGANKKNICIIVNTVSDEILPASQMAFLTSILKACKLSTDYVAVLNHRNEAVEIQQLRSELQPNTVLLFGVSPLEIGLPINFPQFKLQSYDSVTYLFAPELTEVSKDSEEGKLLKSKLWLCLKQLFQI